MSTPARPPTPPAAATAPAIAFYSADNYVPEDSVGFLIRRVVNLVGHQIERQLEASDLTNAQWVPLFKLYLSETYTVADLARGCQLDASAMTRLLDRLETKGLCRRERSQEDRRVVNIELTDEGREAAKAIPVVLSNVLNAHLAGFSVEEHEALTGFLRRILHNALALSDNPSASTDPRSPE